MGHDAARHHAKTTYAPLIREFIRGSLEQERPKSRKSEKELFFEKCKALFKVSEPYSLKSVKSRYRKLSQKAHPDKGGSNEEMVRIR